MDTLLNKYSNKIKGILEGFDRIVFKGRLKPICFAAGMQFYLSQNGVLNKDYKDWVSAKSAAIVADAEEYTRAQSGKAIEYLSSCHIRKEAAAHGRQKELGIQSGLIGTWSCVESCNTFRAAYDKAAGFPQIKADASRCKHLYFYYDHEDYGFMSIRLQTWAPYEIQVALNGRGWLKRLLEKSGREYVLEGNKFLDIDDFAIAQQLLDSQLDTRWVDALAGFLPDVFPSMGALLGGEMSYTWTLWQSEWAKDYIFCDPQVLSAHMEHLLRHAFLTGTGERVLRYFGRPVRANGQPHWAADPELLTRVNRWHDGARIRHWIGKNSLKAYNEQNVLRFEFTMNDPTQFRIRRTAEGSPSKEKRLLPMRKGIADIAVRTQICSSRIKNLTEQVATLEEDISVGELLSQVIQPIKANGKRYRSLDVTGKDLALLRAVADPKYNVDAITNKHLQDVLCNSPWANGLSGRSLSARISRHLRLLREHGLIKKLPNQHRYILTAKGRLLTTAVNQFLGAKVSDLAVSGG
jgi:hypothetical protein